MQLFSLSGVGYELIDAMKILYYTVIMFTFSSGSIFVCRSLATGNSPDGSVTLVLSMYIGL